VIREISECGFMGKEIEWQEISAKWKEEKK
jgi:hypothetical protein